MSIRIFITGGTFDKEYNELNGELYFKDTHLHDLLEMGRCRISTEIRTLMMIDSLEMTAEDRDCADRPAGGQLESAAWMNAARKAIDRPACVNEFTT